MNDGALCSRMPPFVVSSRAMNERPSLRNSREQTVCSSNSSRGGRTAGTARGRLDFADAGEGRGFGFAFEGFGRAFGRGRDAFLAGFARAFLLPPDRRGFEATAGYLPRGLRFSGAEHG